MTLADHLNGLCEEALHAVLAKCCASQAWIEGMMRRRPFASDHEVLVAAAKVWRGLGKSDWLEAFASHPKIGDLESLLIKYTNTSQLAAREQAGMLMASEETIRRLAENNQAYENKFGYIFIVCASGKSADEMLDILDRRLANDPAIELPLAADEQWKITRLRLQGIAP